MVIICTKMSTGRSCDGINFSNNPVQADYEQVFSKNRHFKNCFFLFRDRVIYVSAITSETNCTDAIFPEYTIQCAKFICYIAGLG